MASLNTLRTKFGYVLSGVIAFALLAFIFSLKSDMGFTATDPVVGEVNSEEVLYSEYISEYQDVKNRSGLTESTEQEAASLANAAWQSMISKKLFIPGFAQLGLSMSEAERMAVINGKVPTQTFASAFTDPATGVYNAMAVSEFLSQSAVNPEIDAIWSELNTQAAQERAAMKYSALVRSGAYVNKLEVAEGVASSNKSYSGKVISMPYKDKADSLYTVSDSEIKKYYQAHKEQYKKNSTRQLSYVLFSFDPTEEDIINIENTALEVSKEFEASDDLKAFVRANLNGNISNNYRSVAQLSKAELDAFATNSMYGPINNNNTWVMSRAASSIMAPDTVGLRHIVLNYTQEALADSLYTALKGGADFAAVAQEHSLAQTAQMGGEVGVLPFSSFTDEFVTALAPSKKGDVIKVTSGDMIQIIEVYRADKASRHFQVATVEYPVEASQATIGALHSEAGLFSMAAKGGIDKFNGSADNSGVVARSATMVNGDRTIRMINDSREIARWAYGAEAGDLSEIFKTDAGYVVAMLTNVDDELYSPISTESTMIRSAIIREKKFADIAKLMAGSSIEAIAEALDLEVEEFNDVTYSAQYIPNIGREPKVVGAITLGKGGMSAPIQGSSAVFVVSVDPAVAVAEQTEDMVRVRAQAATEERVSQYVFNAVQGMANIKDLRGKFF